MYVEMMTMMKVMMWLFRLGLARDFSGSGRGSPVVRWGPNKVHCLSCPFLLFSNFSIIIRGHALAINKSKLIFAVSQATETNGALKTTCFRNLCFERC